MDKTYNRIEAVMGQRQYCERTGAPHFAPKSGICWNCNRIIYETSEKVGYLGEKVITGISVEEASTSLVTGCPHCFRSYCE